jgi:hypothetical protein
MKKYLCIALIGLFTAGPLSAQQNENKVDDKDVPQAVRTAFDNQFDNTMMVNWKKKGENYKAMFTMNMKKHMAEFSSSGELIAKGEKIDRNDLPTAVSDVVKRDYSSSNIDEIYRVEKNGQTQYMVKLDTDPAKKIIYDAQGKVIKEKTKQ